MRGGKRRFFSGDRLFFMSKLAGVVVAVDGRENGKEEGRQSQANPSG